MIVIWLVTAHYFCRLGRKPWFIVFLLAVPFLLLLAEFSAFGRSDKPPQVSPVRIAVSAELALSRSVLSCLGNQPGHPIDIVTSSSSSQSDPAGLSLASDQKGKPQIVTRGRSEPSTDSLFASSVLRICQAAPQPAVQLSLKRRRPNPQVTTGKRDFLAHFFPGLALFGALFVSQAITALVWRDQECGVQKRLRTFPISASTLTMGPLLFVALGVAAALLLTIMAGAIPLGIDLRSGLTLLLLTLGFAVFAAGLQLLLGLLSGSVRTAQAVSASTNMLLAFLGGGFVPLALYPPFLQVVAYALPNGAAQTGMSQAIMQSTSGSMMPFVTVWTWAVVAVLAALLVQSRRVRT